MKKIKTMICMDFLQCKTITCKAKHPHTDTGTCDDMRHCDSMNKFQKCIPCNKELRGYYEKYGKV